MTDVPRPNKSTNVQSPRWTSPRERIAFAALRAALAVLQSVSPNGAARAAEALFFSAPRKRRSRIPLPAGAERLELDGPAGPLAVWSWGSGPAVYLLHGWGGRAEQLGAFVAPLVKSGFRAVALDAPAHGRSTGRRSSIPEFARALGAVARRCGPPHAVIAHSLGAAATTFAMREGLTVDRLVFLGPPADPVAWVEAFMERLALKAKVRSLVRSHSERRLRMDWDDLRVAPPSVGGRPPELLVVHDREDREVTWEDGAAIVRPWPGARLMTTTGLGHQRILRARDVVAAVMRFVARPDGSAEAACAHGSPVPRCADCVLEAEMFVPDARRVQGDPAALTPLRGAV